MPDESAAITVCPRCSAPLPPGVVACPNCGLFVHLERLQQLSAEAMQFESTNPTTAAAIWNQALPLLPADSPQYQMIRNRIGVLAAGFAPPDMPTAPGQRVVKPPDSLSIALLKTIGSMIVSIIVYAWYFEKIIHAPYFESIIFAAGFVVLMLVHELGHVIANRYYGISASPPIFIPFMGAVINLRQRPPNAKVEAIIGIGGPVLGTIGAIVCYLLYLQTGQQILLVTSYFGFMLNLFNLLPVPPLDGGRVTAAVSPWIWMLGLGGLAWMFIRDFQAGHIDYILLLVLFYAVPRIKATLRGRERFSEYYNISRASSWTIAAVYVVLGVVLLYLFQHTSAMVRFH
jgi:Zn-dependent protease